MIKKYKFFSNPEGYQVNGYIRKDMIINIITSMRTKGLFEVRAFLIGDSNAQVIYYGTKEECLSWMEAFATQQELKDPVGNGVSAKQ